MVGIPLSKVDPLRENHLYKILIISNNKIIKDKISRYYSVSLRGSCYFIRGVK